MKTILVAILAVFLAVLYAIAFALGSPANAYFTQDDRYFDSRATAQKPSVRKAERQHVKGYRHSKKVVSRRKSLPHDKLTLTTADEQRQNRRETIQYNPSINKSATFPAHAVVLGGRPAGCPARFCGCGASLHLFGRIIPFLNLAANWLRFPRAAPAPGMAAARRGHVFVLKQHIEGKKWLVYDANSGGRKTRLHPRSIAGFTVVNPRAGPS